MSFNLQMISYKSIPDRHLYLKEFTFIFIVMALMTCTPGYKPYKIIIEGDYVEVHFGRRMSKSLLDSISTVLMPKGITLGFPEVQYDGDKLSKIEFTINDGIHSGRASTNFVNRIKPFGFKVDRRPNAETAFVVGDLKN